MKTCEIEVAGEGESLPTTRFRPADPASVHGSWILLHGVTRPGRRHPALVRFARAVAGTGAVVLVPEIGEWSRLELAPERTGSVVRACVRWFEECEETSDAPVLAGFSFGAPQALRTAAKRELRDRIGGVVAFGGYLDVARTFRFQLTGRHEWRGREAHLDPDPYGRWVVGANYLPEVPETESSGDVAEALRKLAAAAGDRQIPADSRELDPVRVRLRKRVDPGRRPLFDLFAPGPGEVRDPERLRTLAEVMARAAERVAPDLYVRRRLEGIRCPVELVHGRDDRLIPYTETFRLAEAMPSSAPMRVTITGLFTHSRRNPLRAGVAAAREAWRFLRLMRRVMSLG